MHIHSIHDEHDDAFRQALARSGALEPREPTTDLVAGRCVACRTHRRELLHDALRCARRSGKRQPLQQWHCWSFPPLLAHST
jgi:hypothetical protein